MPNKRIAPCKCGFLERQANLPDSPIRFDAQLNEYHFLYLVSTGGTGKMLIYHCPFCGGRAPQSRRDTLFATLTEKECQRLVMLTKRLRTLADVLTDLGQPDIDDDSGLVWVTPEREGKPETTQNYRTLIYTKMSETADVHVTVSPTEQVAITFMGKYIGPSAR